jgi:hypothetical protein
MYKAGFDVGTFDGTSPRRVDTGSRRVPIPETVPATSSRGVCRRRIFIVVESFDGDLANFLAARASVGREKQYQQCAPPYESEDSANN